MAEGDLLGEAAGVFCLHRRSGCAVGLSVRPVLLLGHLEAHCHWYAILGP